MNNGLIPVENLASASEVVKELSQGNLVTDDVIGASITPTGADPAAISGLNNVAAKEVDAGKHNASSAGPNSLESITPEEGEWTQVCTRSKARKHVNQKEDGLDHLSTHG
ncbi:hypothetical protein RIF29_19138 [Crotalaria pallida]|uniref:Uncharacterized protein n=1 Tax=Crotalaria pallida TaxID=3830 RepID=A0AAN9F0R9_CROPI